VTFGQSIRWTDRQPVLAVVHELLQPGGAVALIAPAIEHGTPPADAPAPPIPHGQIEALIGRYLDRSPGPRTYERSLELSPFGESHVAHAPGRPDIICSIDEVVSNYLSMSFAAPDRFGDQLDDVIADLEALLITASPSGVFHDRLGDTAIIWATKPLKRITARLSGGRGRGGVVARDTRMWATAFGVHVRVLHVLFLAMSDPVDSVADRA
jgi:hypothetical protein